MGAVVHTPDEGARERLRSVRAKMNFSPRPGQASGGKASASVQEPVVTEEVTIYDGTPIVGEFSLHREGFEVIKHNINIPDERDPDVFIERYMAQLTPFIKEHFKASWVVTLPNGAIVRRASYIQGPDAAANPTLSPPASFVHTDFAPVAGPYLAALSSQTVGVPIQSYSRLIIVQTWQVLTPPPQDMPLAFCDGRTLFKEDVSNGDYNFNGVKHKVWMIHHSPKQKWYYLPELTRDDLVVFKGYDSDDKTDAYPPHSAFNNRALFPNANSRESVETRFFVYYE